MASDSQRTNLSRPYGTLEFPRFAYCEGGHAATE
jgi:hypothetical protein